MILDYLGDDWKKVHLARCARVNKLWAAQATSLLWKDTHMSYFSTHLSVARRPHYASKVRTIYLTTSEDMHSLEDLGRDLPLPRLSKLSTRAPGHGECYSYWYKSSGYQILALLSFLEARPSIDKVTVAISRKVGQEVITQLLRHLAHREGLKELSLENGDSIRQHDLPETTGLSAHPFPCLKVLHLSTEATVIAQLLPLLPHLLEFRADLDDPTDDILAHVARCSNLTSVRIRFAAESRISGRDLVNLAQSCRGLQHIGLSCFGNLGSDVTDAHIDCVASLLEHLKVFAMNTSHAHNNPPGLTVQSLKSLGSRCPNLKVCIMPDPILLVELGLEGPCLFPKLKFLGGMDRVTRSQTGVQPTLREMTLKVLRYHCPLVSDGDLARLARETATDGHYNGP